MDIFGVLILGPQLRVMERSAPYKEKKYMYDKSKDHSINSLFYSTTII